jgi:hypothetical protein
MKKEKAPIIIPVETPSLEPDMNLEERETLVVDVLDALRMTEVDVSAKVAEDAEFEMMQKMEEDARIAGVLAVEGISFRLIFVFII